MCLWQVAALAALCLTSGLIAHGQIGAIADGTSAPQVQQPSKGPLRVSGPLPGMRIGGANPVYPKEAKAAGVSGAVTLHVIIGKDGKIQQLNVISGPEILRQASLDAVRTWIYRPYLLNGQPAEKDTTITVNFWLPRALPQK